MGRLGGTQQRPTVLRAIMSRPGICDSDSHHDVSFVIYVHVQHRFPLARTMAFPNEQQLCHHLLGDEHYSNRWEKGR